MKKNFVLISPPEKHILMEAGDRPNMSLLYLASALKREGHNPVISDLNHDSYKVLNEKMQGADYAGITTITPYYNWITNFSKHLKQNFPDTKLIAGGPHATVAPKSLEGMFDHIVIGEGEKAIVDIANGDKSSKMIKSPYSRNIDSLSSPLDSLTPGLYGLNQEGYRTMTMLTSRSCNFDCFFCTKDILGKNQRVHSIGRVEQEVDKLKKLGFNSVYFLDDCFTSNMSRASEMANMLKSKGITYRAGTRTDRVDNRLLKELKDSGMRSISYGLEHMDDNVLHGISKRNTTENHTRSVRDAHNNGLKVRGSFIVNLPGATRESNMKTLKFAIDENLEFADFYPLVAYPGTPLWENPEKFGVEIIDKNYGASNQTGFVSNVDNKTIDKEELPELVKEMRQRWSEFKGLDCAWEAHR